MVGSLGAPLVPGIAAREGVSLETAQWSLTATLLVAAIATPVVGRLGSGPHRRAVMLGSIGLVAVGALLAALPFGFTALVVGRALQGVAFGVSALALAVARDVLPARQVGAALGTISVANVVSAGLGFPVAALTAEWFGVKGAFGAGFAMTAVALVLGLRAVPPSRSSGRARVDWMGALLVGGSTLALLLGMSRTGQWGYTSPWLLGLLAGGLVLGAVGVWWLLRVPAPLVDLRLAARPGPLVANVSALVSGLGMYLMMAMVMVLVQAGAGGGYGLAQPVSVAGLMLVPFALASAICHRWVARLADRVGPGALLPLGSLAFGAANLLLALWHAEVWQLLLVMAIGGVGSGLAFHAMPLLVVRDVPQGETGSAMSFNIVLRFVGFSFGSALSLAVLEGMSTGGRPTEAGFVAVAWIGAAVSLVAAAACLVLARTATARPVLEGYA